MDKTIEIKLKSGEVKSGISLSEVDELFRNNLVDKDCLFRESGASEWRVVGEYFDEPEESSSEATYILNLKKLKESHLKNEEPKEFQYEQEDPFEGEELPVEDSLEEQKKENELSGEEAKESPANLDKTVINNSTKDYLEQLKKEKIQKEKELEKSSLDSAAEDIEEEIDIMDEKTEVFSRDDIKLELMDAHKQERKLERQRLRAEREKEKKENRTFRGINIGKNINKKKKLLLLLVGLIFLVVLFVDDNKNKKITKIQIKEPVIEFPIRYDQPNAEKAKELYLKGLKSYRKGEYVELLHAAKFFKMSVENKFKDNPAAAKLISTYSRLIKNSETFSMDANTIFRLVQIYSLQAQEKPEFATSFAIFFLESDKVDASLRVIDKYLSVEGNKPSLELFSVYLRALVKKGNYAQAKEVARKLESQKLKDYYVVHSLVNYYKSQGEDKQIAKILSQTINSFSNSMFWLVAKGDLLLKSEDWKGLKKVIIKIKSLNAGASKMSYADYLRFRGFYKIVNKKILDGTKDLKKSLELNENLELLTKLSGLSNSEDKDINDLIIQSRAKKLLISAKQAWLEDNKAMAFRYILEATDIAPNYIPGRLFLSKLQLEHGYYNDAINKLEKLYKEFSSSSEVLFSLTDAYIRSYKFESAKRFLNIIVALRKSNEGEYETLTAKYFIFKDDFNKSVGWLKKAINKNPLNDDNIYQLVKLLVRYKKFDKAKFELKKAMELDPSKIKYRLAFAEILYEVEGTTSAIGYLYDLLKDFPDEPSLISALGIYYYRSGQIKNFKRMKKKLLKLPKIDETLFSFLLKAARLDDDQEKVIEYSKKLIEISPGNLEDRLKLSEIYINKKMYKEALKELKGIKDRFDTYPRLQYYFARLYLLTGEVDKAIVLAKKEVKENPGIIDSYILLGDIYKENKELLKAKEYYLKANRINSRNVESILGLAIIDFNTDKYDMALDQYIKAKEIEPNRAEIYKYLGDVYRRIGQTQLAVTNYKFHLELDPTSKYKNQIQNYINNSQ